MRYYQLKIKLWDELRKTYPEATGATLAETGYFESQGKIYLSSGVMDQTPIFDYFSLMSISQAGSYDWILLDAYSFAGRNIPMIKGYLVSKKLKEILERFVIQSPFRFYESRLMYQGEKYEYYIFQLANIFYDNLLFEKCTWQISTSTSIHDITDYPENIKSVNEYNNGRLPTGIYGKKIFPKSAIFHNYVDLMHIFSVEQFAISESLKNAIEQAGITGFDITPIEHIDFEFENGVPESMQ